MKKLVAICFVLGVFACLCGCGGKEKQKYSLENVVQESDAKITCTFDGVEHYFNMCFPEKTEGAPLVLMLHGHGESPESFSNMSHFEEKANELWLKAAQQGLPRAQCNLGLSYLDGTGILQDSQKAVYWLSKAAEGGDTHAAVCLGRSLLKGYSGVEKNCEKGLAFLKQAATRGEASAFHLLIDYSIDVEHDTQKALHYVNELEKIGGNLTGKECVLLALEILTCKESTYEEKRYATDLLEQAIDYDNPTAALLMGLCYDGGIAVDLNREQANRFYRCASRLGSHLAEQILEYYETSE